jgi:SAM-dependent methyltransferase
MLSRMQNAELIYISERLRELVCEQPILEIGAGWDHEFHREPFRDIGHDQFYTHDVTNYENVAQDFLGDICRRSTIPDEIAGAALIFNVLEHVYAPWLAVDELWRVVKPGGTVIGSVPLRTLIHRWDRDYWRFCPVGVAYLFRRFRLTHLALDGNAALPANVLFACRKEEKEDWADENQKVALNPEIITGNDYVTPSAWKKATLRLLRRFNMNLDIWYGPWAVDQLYGVGFKSWTVRDYASIANSMGIDLHRSSPGTPNATTSPIRR